MRALFLAALLAAPLAGQFDYDVEHYKLELKVDPTARQLTGTCTMTAKSLKASLAKAAVDLYSNMTVSAVSMPSGPAAFTRPTNQVLITLDRAYGLGERFETTIAYSGRPTSGGWGSFGFDSHSGQPIVWSLSQPWWGKTWWPNKDQLADKSTAEIWLTVPDTLYAVSNGKLMGVDPAGAGWQRFRWQVHYPIIPYLISMAVSNYQIRTDVFTWNSKQMPMEFYVYPENWNSVQTEINAFKDIMRVFSEYYGEYPWMTGTIEKVGIAQFPWGGGMEHQTVASQGGFTVWLSAHELAHQWWGDCITCKTWKDIWLNEGFASFSEALWEERKPGGSFAAYKNWMVGNRRPASLGGTVYCYDDQNQSAIFSGTNSYDKGAWVVHQLRGVLGETDFRRCLDAYWKAYFGDSATTEDFRIVCEGVVGRDLKWFFQEWVYDKGGPLYRYGWKPAKRGAQDLVELTIEQTQDTYGWNLFSMPIELSVLTSAGTERVKVWNSAWFQSYSIPVKGAPLSVALDPDEWILKQAVNSTSYSPMLSASASTLSAAAGGKIAFNLNAGGKAAGRPYLLLASASGMAPGTPLPGGGLLPLNLDALTSLCVAAANGPMLGAFHGTLDAAGRASAQLAVAPGLLTGAQGQSLDFAFVLVDNLATASNGLTLLVVP